MMLILLTLIMFIIYFPHSHPCSHHHHHHPDHSEFLYHRKALYMLPGSPTNQLNRYKEIIKSFGEAPLENIDGCWAVGPF